MWAWPIRRPPPLADGTGRPRVKITVGSLIVLLVGSILTLASVGPPTRRVNALALYIGTWTFVVFSFLTSPDLEHGLQPTVVALLALSTTAFVGGYLVSQIGESRREAARFEYSQEKLWVAYRWGVAALAAYLVVQTFVLLPYLRQVGGVHGILAGNGQAFRRAYLSAALESNTNSVGNGAGVLIACVGYGLFLGSLTLVWAGHYAAKGQIRVALPPLLLMAAYSLISLQRSSFLYSLLIFLASWYFHATRTGARRRSQRLSITAVTILVATAVAVVFIPLFLRSLSNTAESRQAGVRAYVISGLVGLNALHTVDPTLQASATGAASPYRTRPYAGPPPGEGHGAFTFQGLVSIAHRLGLPVAAPPASNYFVRSEGAYGVSNTFSYIIYFYDDGRWLGVAIGGFLLGFASGRLQKKAFSGSLMAVPAACILLATVAMSWFGISLLQDFRYSFIALAAFFLTPWLTDMKASTRGHKFVVT